jgi:hypothetical protein
LDFAFVNDNEDPTWLKEVVGEHALILDATERPKAAVYNVGPKTHAWNETTFDHLALQKQRLLDIAVEKGYDHFWLVDSDLLLSPLTLQSLISNDLPIVNAVFWTQWTPEQPPMPQVWTKNPYDMTGLGMTLPEFFLKLHDRQLVRVMGGGACTLISTEVMDRVRYYPRLEGLPDHNMWQGEDRTFAVLAQRHHIHQYADPWPNIFHCYHPEQRTPDIMDQWMHELAQVVDAQQYGLMLSFRIKHLQMDDGNYLPETQSIRTRFGSHNMLPELERLLMQMRPGEERLLKLHYPMYWPFNPGAQQEVVVNLVDVRAAGPAPILHLHSFEGAHANGN